MRKPRASQPTSQEQPAPRRERKMSRTPMPDRRQENRSLRRPRSRRSSLGAGLAVLAGRTAGALSRRLHLGGGTSITGVVAQRVYPDIVEHLAGQLEYGSVIVTGTNGKTTTSSFISAILRDVGLRVWRNREGSNLLRGVASALVIRAKPNGRLNRSGRAISIFEIDEATLPQIVQVISPRVAVFTNLFRDQLDRYGEVNSVEAHWQRALKSLPEDATLVLNADDPSVASLGELFSGKTLYYGIEDRSLDLLEQGTASGRHQVIDTRTCPRCGSEYIYDARFYSHMGHYHCPHCDLSRPRPDVRATHIQSDNFDRMRVQIETEDQQREIIIPLPGLYNIYNALAAAATALALDVSWDAITSGIEQSKPVFGRGERIQAEGRTVRLLLAKNPTGFNEVLRTLFSDSIPRHVLFVLNDNTADGRDISWIWDVDFERVAGQTQTLAIAGTRALDLALRLKYAGIEQSAMSIFPPTPLRAARSESAPNRFSRARRSRRRSRVAERTVQASVVEEQSDAPVQQGYGLKQAIDAALSQTPVGETLFVIPTYTGLLEVHRELEQRGLTPRYWEGRDA
jgi:UDP-N-acetylmuramyl tripeptide synthase